MTSRPVTAAYVPARRLPLLYFGFAHASLIVAAGVAVAAPSSVTGFYYHPWMIGVVHLVTLGWITGSILGALFIVGPLALRMPMPTTRLDYWAYAFFTIGVVGMVSHFWIEQFSGMAWSAGMVLAALVQVAVKVLRRLASAPLPRAIALHIGLAMLNLVAAATLGILIGADREADVMPGATLSNVYAHAHLAAVGWAVMMVMGVGYRMFQMVFPSRIPNSRRVVASALLTEAGVLGLASSLLWGRGSTISTLLVITGIGVFLFNIRWMAQHRRPPPPALPQPDWGVRQSMLALFYIALAVVAGAWLALLPSTPSSAKVAMAYGTLGLVGGLSQIIVGIEHRLIPLFHWHTTFAGSGFALRPPSPHTMGSQSHRGLVFALWAVAVPLLVFGLAAELSTWVRIGATSLFMGTSLHTLNTVRTLRSGAHPSHAEHVNTTLAR